jgi:very-short-patch-repair endonuclease
LAQRPVEPGNDYGPRKQWTGKALVMNEIAKQRVHISLRDLLERAGKSIQQLMPCFMMSPLSVAQFLKPGVLKFDLIVMDEASQLRPEDAIGAIARGSQIVVVGDPKQLPPTNFFREADGVPDEDDLQTAADEQSILDQSLTIMHPPRRLKWHYRSRHGSLIAFSNKEFYDNQLVVFPSPYHNHPDYGVRYFHVADGRFRNRVNAPEAQRVAVEAIAYVKKHPERSLGIVTLNQPQAELVALEIDRLATEHPEFEAWRQKHEPSLEPFFIKNLENVQGDERDTIFISTVYGRDEEGNFHQRFGPINNQGGHRRLNVLFTRSKCQTFVFSSIDPADIRAEEKSPWGVRALKGYLKFAKDGVLDIAVESGRSPDSEFEVAVIDVLRNSGFEAVPQIGIVGYFIDIAVRHPQRSGEFVLGVECDGAMYHSSRSARDRDRLRQEVLERLNWRIHRIWSLDWYRNPKRESERLMKAVNEAVAAAL